ncbi:MAG: U32 family peptidase [Clostridia bacterium]|nr:U32 family peptidase [Clostridia bacterium]
MIELLAPAGDFDRLKSAVHFGADAVYIGGAKYSLRAGAKGADGEQLALAVDYCHSRGKKLYVAVNIFADDDDIAGMRDYLISLHSAGVDAIIVSDAGIISLARKYVPDLELHLSTQANTTNSGSARFWADMGIKRIVTAREMSIDGIKRMRDALRGDAQIECFVHGAMCISYSGRCLLSDYFTGRRANKGECVQACRWEYTIGAGRGDAPLTIGQEDRGSYILNSKDMCMLPYLDSLAKAGVDSFKIEGRMKTQYYVASAVSAYRAGIDALSKGDYAPPSYALEEVYKHSHRQYCTGFYFKDRGEQCLESSKPETSYDFIAEVKGRRGDLLEVEQRGRFKIGDTLETLSADCAYTAKSFTVTDIKDTSGAPVPDAKYVCQRIVINCPYPLADGDMLRRAKI